MNDNGLRRIWLLTVQKRDGRKVKFDKEKIKIAVLKAFIDVDGEETAYAKEKARDIANYIESLNKSMTVEDIQDEVVNKLMASTRKDVAAKYVEYRYKRRLIRESNTTDKSIIELIDGVNDYWNSENSNKSASVVSSNNTKRLLSRNYKYRYYKKIFITRRCCTST